MPNRGLAAAFVGAGRSVERDGACEKVFDTVKGKRMEPVSLHVAVNRATVQQRICQTLKIYNVCISDRRTIMCTPMSTAVNETGGIETLRI